MKKLVYRKLPNAYLTDLSLPHSMDGNVYSMAMVQQKNVKFKVGIHVLRMANILSALDTVELEIQTLQDCWLHILFCYIQSCLHTLLTLTLTHTRGLLGASQATYKRRSLVRRQVCFLFPATR